MREETTIASGDAFGLHMLKQLIIVEAEENRRLDSLPQGGRITYLETNGALNSIKEVLRYIMDHPDADSFADVPYVLHVQNWTNDSGAVPAVGRYEPSHGDPCVVVYRNTGFPEGTVEGLVPHRPAIDVPNTFYNEGTSGTIGGVVNTLLDRTRKDIAEASGREDPALNILIVGDPRHYSEMLRFGSHHAIHTTVASRPLPVGVRPLSPTAQH